MEAPREMGVESRAGSELECAHTRRYPNSKGSEVRFFFDTSSTRLSRAGAGVWGAPKVEFAVVVSASVALLGVAVNGMFGTVFWM
jgi:hypothetical protein